MSLQALLILVVFINVSSLMAQNYACLLSSTENKGLKEIWKGHISFQEGHHSGGRVYVLREDGSTLQVTDSIPQGTLKEDASAEPLTEKALKALHGSKVFGLSKRPNKLVISTGQVNVHNKKNMAPFSSVASTDPGAKFIALEDRQLKVEFSCEKAKE